jgi:hypothetical protein
VPPSKTIQTYESNGLDWVSFISQLQKKENKTHSNVTMSNISKLQVAKHWLPPK